jgi:hypothetical protein
MKLQHSLQQKYKLGLVNPVQLNKLGLVSPVELNKLGLVNPVELNKLGLVNLVELNYIEQMIALTVITLSVFFLQNCLNNNCRYWLFCALQTNCLLSETYYNT